MPRITPTSRLGRRAVLGGTLVTLAGTLVATSGCDVGSLRGDGDTPPSAPPSGSPGGRHGASATQDVDPTTPPPDLDQAVVDRALAQIVATRETVQVSLRRFPRLRASLEPLVGLHDKHARTLTAHTAPRPPKVRAARTERQAMTAVAHAEEQLQRTLTSSSVDADSGVLAAELASMAAAVAQRRVAL